MGQHYFFVIDIGGSSVDVHSLQDILDAQKHLQEQWRQLGRSWLIGNSIKAFFILLSFEVHPSNYTNCNHSLKSTFNVE